MWSDLYTRGRVAVDQPRNMVFEQILETCKKLGAEIYDADNKNYSIWANAKTSWKTFGHKFHVVLEKQDSGTVVELYYNFTGSRGGPYKDFTEKFFEALSRRITLESGIKYDVTTLKMSSLKNVTQKDAMNSNLCIRCSSKLHFISLVLVIVFASLVILATSVEFSYATLADFDNEALQQIKWDIKNHPDPGNQAILLIFSDSNWRGSLEDATGDSATISGYYNKEIPFQCNNPNGVFSISVQNQLRYGYVAIAVIQNDMIINGIKYSTDDYGAVSVIGHCNFHDPNALTLNSITPIVSAIVIAILIILLIVFPRTRKNLKKGDQR